MLPERRRLALSRLRITPAPHCLPMVKGHPMIVTRIRRLLESEEAATAAEYAVLLALILLALISAVNAVGHSTSGLWQDDVSRITTASGGP